MKKIKALFLPIMAFLAICFATPGQQYIKPEGITFWGTEAFAPFYDRSVFAVQVARTNQSNGLQWTPIGSGFFVASPSNMLVGVTCDHVIAATLSALNAEKTVKTVFLGVDVGTNYLRLPCQVIYRDKDADIAVLQPMGPLGMGNQIANSPVSYDMFDDDSVIQGRGILTIGYPLGLGMDQDQNHPLIRFGMIAQCAEKTNFIIDGIANHGNSGSPVFSIKYPNSRFVGMITSFQTDQITLWDENGHVAAQLPYNSGLSRAVRAPQIMRAIDTALKTMTNNPAN